MFSSRTICSTQSMLASDAAYICWVRSCPYMETSLFTPSLSPVSTMPPLRELAPQPIVSDSRTATVAPRLAKARAAERPVKPAPIIATSALSGSDWERSVCAMNQNLFNKRRIKIHLISRCFVRVVPRHQESQAFGPEMKSGRHVDNHGRGVRKLIERLGRNEHAPQWLDW